LSKTLGFIIRNLIRLIVVALVLVMVVAGWFLTISWRALFHEEVSTEERLSRFPAESLPLDSEVQIYWDDYQIPYIEASTDRDAAFALGLVHCHLRGNQISVFKRVSQGRMSEMLGPITVEIDKAIRALDLGYAADSIIASMDEVTRDWMEAFVAGLNYYQDHTEEFPPEYALMGIDPEPFTVRDLVIIGRLAGADVNWFMYFALLPERNNEDWADLWSRTVDAGSNGRVSFNADRQPMRTILENSRSGSNSIAIAPEKTRAGVAILANDPHLGVMLPNFWMLGGLKCPSQHTVGMMIPGLPFVTLGRNQHLSWGGTNMRAASSDMYDVSKFPPDSFEVEPKSVDVRFWLDEDYITRRTSLGPVLSDMDVIPSDSGEHLALQWVGHQVSDEFGAFLRSNRATTIDEFVEAFRGYAVSSQNMLVVDTAGNIAMTLALRLPIREYDTPDNIVFPSEDSAYRWHGSLEAPDLPVAKNPPEGFIASSNNKPTSMRPPLGFFFSGSERVGRIQELVSAEDQIDFEFIRRLQQDVYSPDAHALAKVWLERIDSLELSQRAPDMLGELREWDGHYHADSRGPVAFEMLTTHLVDLVLQDLSQKFLYRSWTYVTKFLAKDLKGYPVPRQREILDSAISLAETDFQRWQNWGDKHRLRAMHNLGWIPLVGEKLIFADLPASGSRETVMKTNHDMELDRDVTTYGSQSRHVSIMDHPDNNYFVLFGGNDGWIGSENFADQVDLWQKAEYIKLPLMVDAARARSTTQMVLTPRPNTK